jgi:hypothetical protein
VDAISPDSATLPVETLEEVEEAVLEDASGYDASVDAELLPYLAAVSVTVVNAVISLVSVT